MTAGPLGRGPEGHGWGAGERGQGPARGGLGGGTREGWGQEGLDWKGGSGVVPGGVGLEWRVGWSGERWEAEETLRLAGGGPEPEARCSKLQALRIGAACAHPRGWAGGGGRGLDARCSAGSPVAAPTFVTR